MEKTLPVRAEGETHAAWVSRISRDLTTVQLEKLRDALRLHQRYRFDPEGLAATERNQLRELCRAFATQTQ